MDQDCHLKRLRVTLITVVVIIYILKVVSRVCIFVSWVYLIYTQLKIYGVFTACLLRIMVSELWYSLHLLP